MILTIHQKNYKKNRTKIRAYQKKYYDKNKRYHMEKTQRWRKKHLDEYKDYQKKYRKSKEGKLLLSLHRHKRRAKMISTSDGSVTKQAIEGMFIGQNYKCNLCGENIRENYHIDHILPLSKRGTHTIENIQLLCPHCNLTKSDGVS